MGIARWCHLQAAPIDMSDTNISQIFLKYLQAAPMNISATNISQEPTVVLIFLYIRSDCLQSYLVFFSVFNINILVLIFLPYMI